MGPKEFLAKSDIDLMMISDMLTYADIFPLFEVPQKQLGYQINFTFYAEADWIKKHKSKNNFVLKAIQKPKPI